MDIKIVIADDQELFAQGLQEIFKVRAPHFKITALAQNGQLAIEHIRRNLPDIVLMDVRMPVLDGVEATAILHKEFPKLKIIMLTTFDDDDYVKQAIAKGACGYLLKDIMINKLIDVIESTVHGEVHEFLLAGREFEETDKLTHAKMKQEKQAPEWLGLLSFRERAVLKFLIEGYNNYAISRELSLSEQTVKNYISTIYNKAGIHDRYSFIKELRDVDF